MVMLTGIAGECRQGENKIFRKLKHYVKLWKKVEEEWIYKRRAQSKIWIIFFLQRLGNCGNFKQGNPSKEVAGKNAQRLRFLRFNRRPHPGPHYPSEQTRAPMAFITNNSSVNRAI
jgi:hypothetical protein